MNVFVLNTGRCGSTTFTMACRHITNYTSAHEAKRGVLGEARFQYPKNHIEIDNRLVWLLGRLDQTYGDDAIYVHLKRNDMEVAQSFTNRYDGGVMKAYRGGILQEVDENSDPLAVCLDYCHSVNTNIELFLRDKTRKLEINLETIEQDFVAFWQLIGAKGDLDAALAEFGTSYNSSTQLTPKDIHFDMSRPQNLKQPYGAKQNSLVVRALRKVNGLITNLLEQSGNPR
ncbi:hypothetical protein Pse7367_3807 (plasmid) [Thalassoporum mexicanum PCC 7367]|uniref:hypothetical protein n=1 Tax=Thalassoporum mexicanum TaxID=3457544 RepID=UPI00029FDD1B|nr:hypothetical protein [Pseudanabaena sp. PCC 7367]AFY72030.1 hypothetical protein Pse7367_3807 [Pseudanabaena sp. PCC 7367]